MSDDNSEQAPKALILVVDDEPHDLDTLGSLLQAHYDVLAASSGEAALQIAVAAAKPDLILLDVLMPELGGYDVLARLHDNPATRDIPVIIITGLNSTEDEERGFELGAVDYMTKPYCPAIVMARVRTHLELKRARDRLASQNVNLEAELRRYLDESQQVQNQLLQSEKLAAIGQLTAGVTHEINNPVGFVTSNLGSLDSYIRDIFELLDAYEALEGICPADDARLANLRQLKAQKDIDFLREDIGVLISESRQGLIRVSKIVSDLKNFSRVESADWRWVDLHKGIESILNIVWNEIKYHCTLHKEYGDLPEVYCIPLQIDQVLLNLLVNAAQAVPQKGDITIRTGQSGDEIFVSIADTGTGIAPKNLSRLFEPFFTTKPVGKGTGLGLSIAYGIIQKHHGRIDVDSVLGKGTTFTVWLPLKPPVEAVAETAL